MSTASEPEVTTPESGQPLAPAQRWRFPTPPRVRPDPLADHRGGLIRTLALMLALLGTLAGLLSWVEPVPRPEFAPVWVANYQARGMPVAALAQLDRQALRDGNFFPRTLVDAYASQDHVFLERDLNAVRNLQPTESVALYLGGFAARDEQGNVFVFPADAEPDDPHNRLPLRTVLEALRDCPARRKLLVLDIMRPVAAMGEPGIPPGRLGVLADDVASRIDVELEAVPDSSRLVLCAASPGQVSFDSAALGHSVFGFYLLESLRGWADLADVKGRRDGRISVRDTAEFMAARVERWTWNNRAVRQTPVLYGSGTDFNLVALAHGKPEAHLETPPPESYPDWLKSDWELLDRFHADQSYRLAPYIFRQLEATVHRWEIKWRSGYPADEIQKERQPLLDLYRSRIASVRAVSQISEPRSLALERTQGRIPDPTIVTELQQLLAKLEPEGGAGAKTPPPPRAALITEFLKKIKEKSYFDLASAVMTVATRLPKPRPETLQLLDEIRDQRDVQARYVENDYLRRLAILGANTPPGEWPAALVHRSLELTELAEQVESRPASFPWVRSLLDEAAATRYRGEVFLLFPGYTPPEAADIALRDAALRYAAIQSYQDTIEDSQVLLDEARLFLPSCLSLVEAAPELERTWHATTQAVLDLDAALAPPGPEPLNAAQVGFISDTLRIRAESLRASLNELRRPLSRERLKELEGRAGRADAGAPVAREIDAVLTTPLLPTAERVALWRAGQDLSRRLSQQTIDLDRRDEQVPFQPHLRDSDTAPLERLEQERGFRRARLAIGLFRLGGVRPQILKDLNERLTEAQRTRAEPGALAVLGNHIRKVWAETLVEEFREEQEPRNRDRLAWIAPPLDTLAFLVSIRLTPRQEILGKEARELWKWQSGQYHYQSHDLPLTSAFYFEAAREYAEAARQPLSHEAYIQFSSEPELRLTPTRLSAATTLRLQLIARTDSKRVIQVRLLVPGDDVLKVTAALPEAGNAPLGPWTLDLADPREPNTCTIPLRVTFRPDAVADGATVPRGFLVEATVDGQSFHFPISVSLREGRSHPEILISESPQEPIRPLGDLRLRPTGTPQTYYVHVRNPTEKPANLLVNLLGVDGLSLGMPGRVTVPAGATSRVVFPPAPAPLNPVPAGAPALPELTGPLQIHLVDVDNPATVLDSRKVQVAVALPREYVDVAGVQYQPAGAGRPDQLDVRVRARTTLAPPPCDVEMVLPPERMPGFLGARDGTFRGPLPAEGEELRLFARDLRFTEGSLDQGYVYLNVDGFDRAFIFRTSFTGRGDPTTPREDYRPALRIRAAATALSSPKYPVTLEVDNAPTGSTLELALGTGSGSTFQAEVVQPLPEARPRRIGFNPQGPGGSLLFSASVHDAVVPLDTRQIIGPRLLRARLLDPNGREIFVAEKKVTFGDQAPSDVQIVKAPRQILKGTPIVIQATGADTVTGIKDVEFFLGRAVEGKIPPNTPLTAATLLPGSKSLWTALVPLPPDRLGPVEVSVRVTNGAGLARFASTTVEVVDKLPPVLGTVTGTVMEGPRPQAGIEVVLRDEKATEKDKDKDLKTRTRADGTFTFENVPPGNYKIKATKPTANRKAESSIKVEPGQTATVTLELLL